MIGMEPRSKQIVYSIAIVFNHREDILGELSNLFKKRQKELIKDRAETDDGVVINAYLELVSQNKPCITSSDITKIVKEKGDQFEDITPQTIGHIMKSLGFKNEIRNVEGQSSRCFIHDEDLISKLKNRYSLKPMELKCEECIIEPDEDKELQ